VEYIIKQKNLPVEEMTWEDGLFDKIISN